MSLLLLRRSSSLQTTARVRSCTFPYASLSVLYSPLRSPSSSKNCVLRPRLPVHSTSPFVSTPLASASIDRRVSLVAIQLNRYSSRRNSWPRGNEWKSTLKAGGLVLLGTGALIVSASLACGLIIAGAAGFGVYTLYQRFFGPSHFRPASNPLRNLSSNVDVVNDLFRRSRQRTKSAGSNNLDSLLQGMPLGVREVVKTVFSFVAKTMHSSLERARELRRRTMIYLQANKRVRDQVGDDVSVGVPEQWSDSTVNGAGYIKAVFPIKGVHGSAHVDVRASVGQGGKLDITKLIYYNRQNGDKIDLLRDSSAGSQRETVIEAEYVDLDKESKARW